MSRQNISLLTLAIAATAAITAHRFVTWDGALATAGADAAGVARDDAAIGDLISADCIGTAVVEAGAAFDQFALVTSDATGRAVASTAATAITRTAVVAGGAAGDIAVAAIGANDVLVGVVRLDRDATAANVNIGALTSEFSITAAGTINNAGGTSTAGDSLLVIWETRSVRARALQASTGAGDFVEVLLYPA